MNCRFSIFAGPNKIFELNKIIKSLNFKRPVFLIDQNLAKSNTIIKAINNRKLNSIYIKQNEEPTYDDLNLFIKNKKNKIKKYDLIVSIGGGSLLDFAKGIAVLISNKGTAEKYKGFPFLKKNPIPVLAVPSTAGTGSEITFNASFVDTKTQIKMGINAECNYPIATVLDPFLCMSAPFRVFSSTGCDALVHSVESFLSPNATSASKHFSRIAFRLLCENFPKVLRGTKDPQIWLEMQWASVFAMMGLSNSSSGPAGAFSYYLGPIHKIPHGVAGAFFLRHVLKITYRNKDKTLDGLSHDKSPVLDKILRILDLAEIPKTLNGLGINDFDKNRFFEFSKKVSAARKLHSIPFTMKMVEELVEKIS